MNSSLASKLVILMTLVSFSLSEVCFTNPVIGRNMPDPAVLALPDGSGWVMVTTSNFATDPETQSAFPIMFSSDLVNWIDKGYVFPPGRWPSWASQNMWAPEIHLVNGKYVVYFTGGHTVLWVVPKLHVGVAVSQGGPYGPYVDVLGEPLTSDSFSFTGAIDPHYFRDPSSDNHYLLWNVNSPAGKIYIQELDETGTRFLNDTERLVLLTSDKLAEMIVTEGPWMVYRRPFYYLFYSSAPYFTPWYHMRVARSKDLMGPYVKQDIPVIETEWEAYDNNRTKFVGPGHGAVVERQPGEWWLVYHAWLNGQIDPNGESPGRQVFLDRIFWTEDDWPEVGYPSETEQCLPNGHISLPGSD